MHHFLFTFKFFYDTFVDNEIVGSDNLIAACT